MATLPLRVYASLGEELAALREGEVPRWALRLYGAYGYAQSDIPLSMAMQALSQALHHRLQNLAVLLARAEDHGWTIRVDGEQLLLNTGLPPERSEELMEEAGVMTVARLLASNGEGGGLRWIT